MAFLKFTLCRNSASGNGDLIRKQTEKQFLLKCLATALCYLTDKETVLQTLDNILVNVKLTDYSELHSCAEAVGICSRTHLQVKHRKFKYYLALFFLIFHVYLFQVVLDKLATIRKEIISKKSSKFLNFIIKDQKSDVGIERLRYVVLYSYSEVCNEAPSDKLLKVIESEILDYATGELSNVKDFQMRKVCLKTIHSVADAMHPNRNHLHIRMHDRDKVIR